MPPHSNPGLHRKRTRIATINFRLDFPVATILLGYVLGPLVEENFRRALLLSRGDLLIFFERPISAAFVIATILLVAGQMFVALRAARRSRAHPPDPAPVAETVSDP